MKGREGCSIYRKGGKGSVSIEREGRVQYLRKKGKSIVSLKGREGYRIYERKEKVKYL